MQESGAKTRSKLIVLNRYVPEGVVGSLDSIPGTISGTIGKFEQSSDSASPLESTVRP